MSGTTTRVELARFPFSPEMMGRLRAAGIRDRTHALNIDLNVIRRLMNEDPPREGEPEGEDRLGLQSLYNFVETEHHEAGRCSAGRKR